MPQPPLLSAADTFTEVRRPAPTPKPPRIASPVIGALQATVQKGTAIEVPLNRRDPQKLLRAIALQAKKHALKVHAQVSPTTITLWASPKPPKNGHGTST